MVALKLNANGKRIIGAVVFLMAGSAFLFQNCSPAPLESDESDLYSGTTNGDSSYRLPANGNQTLGNGTTCSLTINAPTIAVGGTLTYTITPSSTLPSGFVVYAFGTKDGIPDASEVSPSTSGALIQTYTNPGYLGGNYKRYFQIRDSASRTLCQTNTVSVSLAGPQCTLSTSTPVLKNGSLMVLNIAYGAGTAVPTATTTVQFNGTNNGFAMTPVPYGQTNFTTYSKIMTASDVGNEYIRYITILNTDGSVYCQTNSVRMIVLPN